MMEDGDAGYLASRLAETGAPGTGFLAKGKGRNASGARGRRSAGRAGSPLQGNPEAGAAFVS
jgi:hypothetical protein